MNLIEKIGDELYGVKLDDLEKARYIYLRCCEIFSFDAKWLYYDVFDDYDTYEKMINKKFDIENIDENDLEVICHSFSPYILKPLLDRLTKLNSKVINTGTHSYVKTEVYDQEWKLDATLGDLFNVKLGLPAKGFTCGLDSYDALIKDIDSDLGFCLDKDINYYKNMVQGNSFTDCIENIGYMLRDSKANKYFYDANELFSRLDGLMYSNNNYVYLDKDYNFHKLIDVVGEYSFFDLSKKNDEYSIKRIRHDEYEELVYKLRYK